jgi:type II secretory ATPase GspE/PulE/Tfp pilus assembly ATPase PilB-like protein
MKHRWVPVVLTFVLLLLVGGPLLAAPAGDWPAYQPDPAAGADFRGPGAYLSLLKIIGCWLVFLVWVGTADWISRDVQKLKLKLTYLEWNPIVVGSFFAGLMLFWLIPYFWVGFVLLLIACIAPPTTYIIRRNMQVTNEKRVLTPEHLRYVAAHWLGMIGVKIDAERADPHAKGPPVTLEGRGADDDRENTARLLRARQSPGLHDARQILADGLKHRADSILLDYTQQGVGVRYRIDGVWHPHEGRDRETGDPALESLKLLAGLNPQDRQNRQAGQFGVKYQGIDYEGSIATQGTKTGERVVMELIDPKVRFTSLDDLGMRPKMVEQLMELVGRQQGLFILSAPPGGGLKSTFNVVQQKMDRFTREFMAVEEASVPHEEIENIPTTTFDKSAGQTPIDVLPRLLRMDPNVIVFRDLFNGETLELLCNEIHEEHRLLVTTARAKESAEALLRVMSLGVTPRKYAEAVIGVLNQRLIRKLCDACKEAYAPPPNVLQQLGIPPGRVQAFYRPPQQPEEVCEKCLGVGYHGRMALFEMLVADKNVKNTLAGKPRLESVRAAARKDGMRTLQEEGVLLVAKGVTSLPELTRILKQ